MPGCGNASALGDGAVGALTLGGTGASDGGDAAATLVWLFV
jgi:hypothetical protein